MHGLIDFNGEAPAGSTVEVVAGDEVLATVTADDSGHWTALGVAVPVGMHSIHAIASSVNGSNSRSRSIDTRVYEPDEGDDEQIEVAQSKYEIDDPEDCYVETVLATADGIELEAELVEAVLAAADVSQEQFQADIAEELELRRRAALGTT
jgi:hypothetical protein